MTRRRLGSALGAGLALPPVSLAVAGETGAVAFDDLFAQHDGAEAPGLAVGVIQNGKVVYARGHGRAHLEHPVEIGPDTLFHIASVSKQFAAFAIALLEREGKVDLEADIRDYLPYVPAFGGRRITTRQLLLHTSGLRDQWSLFGLGGKDSRDVLRQEHVVSMIARQTGLNFDPGTEHLYCNTGYTLLAEIVQAVSGQSLRAFCEVRIFRPLGMSRSVFNDDVTEVFRGRADSYTHDEKSGRWQRALLNYQTVGATSLLSTVNDLLKWLENFRNPIVGDAALIQHVASPGALANGTAVNYGFGLMRTRFAGREAIYHTGSDAAFNTILCYFPAEGLGIVCLANRRMDLSTPVSSIVERLLGKPPAPAPAAGPPEVTRARASLEAVAGEYISSSGQPIVLRVKDDALEWDWRWGTPRRVVFTTEDRFRLQGQSGPGFRLIADATGGAHPAAIEAVRASESDAPPRRYARLRREPTDTEGLAGDYRLDELDNTYTLALQDGAWTIRHLWSAQAIKLEPSLRDRFDSQSGSLGSVFVERDGAGAISHLRLDGGRHRGVRLRKLG